MSKQNLDSEPSGWTEDTLGRRVETALGSFNTSIPQQAIKRYTEKVDSMALSKNINKFWLIYSSMISDIKTICPLQDMAKTLADHFSAKIYSYVATQGRNKLDHIADSTSDIEAIFDMYQIDDDYKKLADKVNADGAADEDKEAMLAGAQVADDQSKFVENMQNMFYTFVRTGVLPKGKDMSQGMYIVNKDIITQTPYPNCDFWKTTRSIVPTYANLD